MNLLLPYQKETEHLFTKQELCGILLATPSELYQRIAAYKLINISLKEKDTYINKKLDLLKDVFSEKKLYTSSSGLLIQNYSEKDMLEYKTLTVMLKQVDKIALLKIINKWEENSLNHDNGSLIQNNFKSLVYLTKKIGNNSFPDSFHVPVYEKDGLSKNHLLALKENKAIEVSNSVFSNEKCNKKAIMKNAFERKFLLELATDENKENNLLKSNIYLYNTLYRGAEYSYNIENTINMIEVLNNEMLEKVIKEIPVDIFPLDLPEKIVAFYGEKEENLKRMLLEKSHETNETGRDKKRLNFIDCSLINATLKDISRSDKYISLKKSIDFNSERSEEIEMGQKVRAKFAW